MDIRRNIPYVSVFKGCSTKSAHQVRGKRRGFCPGAAARYSSRTRVPLIFVRFLPVLFESFFLSPSFSPFFWRSDFFVFIVRSQIGEGKWTENRDIRVRDALKTQKTLSDFTRSWQRKKKGCPISKKWDVKSQEMKKTQIRETMKMPCTPYNNNKTCIQKKRKNGGEKNVVWFHKKVDARLKMTSVL